MSAIIIFICVSAGVAIVGGILVYIMKKYKLGWFSLMRNQNNPVRENS